MSKEHNTPLLDIFQDFITKHWAKAIIVVLLEKNWICNTFNAPFIHNLGVHVDVRGGDPDVRGGGRDEAANAGARTADGDVPMVVVAGGSRAVADDGVRTVKECGARTVTEDVVRTAAGE
ncbi:hypothetical protein DPMN_004983 [Dreissena polymorpha]|uniref:Uncharacterized protein n=1 Tax=Dreissena polymorpha TaxID=45954 RepID=A0A9D4MSC5_DREPO|nr:hypothetical protein DPMN_004983 [Dreissena polymorpha]